MLDKEIREKIVKIMELSIEVNGSDKYTVFTNYCGHINSCEFFERKWKVKKKSLFRLSKCFKKFR